MVPAAAAARAGEALEAYIFMGPVYYQKLKHMVGGGATWGMTVAGGNQGLFWRTVGRLAYGSAHVSDLAVHSATWPLPVTNRCWTRCTPARAAHASC